MSLIIVICKSTIWNERRSLIEIKQLKIVFYEHWISDDNSKQLGIWFWLIYCRLRHNCWTLSYIFILHLYNANSLRLSIQIFVNWFLNKFLLFNIHNARQLTKYFIVWIPFHQNSNIFIFRNFDIVNPRLWTIDLSELIVFKSMNDTW